MARWLSFVITGGEGAEECGHLKECRHVDRYRGQCDEMIVKKIKMRYLCFIYPTLFTSILVLFPYAFFENYEGSISRGYKQNIEYC